MTGQILIYAAVAISFLIIAVMTWGCIAAFIDFFRRRDIDGIVFFDEGIQYNLSCMFDPVPGDKSFNPWDLINLGGQK